MTYVVVESCIRCKLTDCVEVCPVDCFHEGPNFLVIDPEERIVRIMARHYRNERSTPRLRPVARSNRETAIPRALTTVVLLPKR